MRGFALRAALLAASAAAVSAAPQNFATGPVNCTYEDTTFELLSCAAGSDNLDFKPATTGITLQSIKVSAFDLLDSSGSEDTTIDLSSNEIKSLTVGVLDNAITEGKNITVAGNPGVVDSCMDCPGVYKAAGVIGTSYPAFFFVCTAGNGFDDGTSSCVGCSSPTYNDGKQLQCVYCPAGRYFDTNSTACTLCEKGKFLATTGGLDASDCKNCPSGYQSSTDRSRCQRLFVSSGACDNACSGHGYCDLEKQCSCWPGYTGSDCSQRACPTGQAWVQDAADAHGFAECSNRGICDRSSGECECFDGFSGTACQRLTCPSSCSGHGRCRLLGEMPQYTIKGPALAWDENAVVGCLCDGGYAGADCSQRVCPHGDDPMTACDSTKLYEAQQVSVSIPMSPGANIYVENDDIALTFKTFANETFFTQTVSKVLGSVDSEANNVDSWFTAASTSATDDLVAALESIPLQRLRDVSITRAAITSPSATYTVTFGGAAIGRQNLLQCTYSRTINGISTYGCPSEGCQPLVKQPRMIQYAGVCEESGGNNSFVDMTPSTAFAALTTDSLIGCPSGVTCTTNSGTEFQGRIDVFVVKSGSSFLVYAKGADGGVTLTNTTTDSVALTLANVGSDGYTYLGTFSTLNSRTIDLSRVAPGAKVKFAANVETTTDACTSDSYHTAFQYSVGTCSSITRVGGSVDANVEFIECGGRGICERSSGLCQCFDGYFGSSCSQQTVLL